MPSIAIHFMGVSVGFDVDQDSNFRDISPPKENPWITAFLASIREDWTRLFCVEAEHSPNEYVLLESVTEFLRHKILYNCQFSTHSRERKELHRAGVETGILRSNVRQWEDPASIVERTLESCYLLLRSHGVEVPDPAVDSASGPFSGIPVRADAIMIKRA